MLSPLTRRQKEILDYVNTMISLNGYAPSLQEVRDHFKLKAISTVHEHLENLKNKGYIKKEMNQARGIQVQKIEELEKYITIKQKGNILDGKVVYRTNLKNDLILDKNLINKNQPVYSLVVLDGSLKNKLIQEQDILIVEEVTDAEKGDLVLLKSGKIIFVDKRKAEQGEEVVGRVRSVLRNFCTKAC